MIAWIRSLWPPLRRKARTFPQTPAFAGDQTLQIDNDLITHSNNDFGKGCSNQTNSPVLPEIIHSGSPTANKYSDFNIFWNSMMTETDHTQQDNPKQNTSTWNAAMKDCIISEDAKIGEHSLQQQEIRREHNKPLHKSQTPNKNTTNRRRLQQLESNPIHGRESVDNDLVVMFFTTPNYNQSPRSLESISRRRQDSVSPKTQECDSLVDSESSVNQTGSSARSTLTSNPSTTPSNPPIPTWTSCLNEILTNDAVESVVKVAVEDRIKDGPMTNGHKENGTKFVSPTAIGLVPNFSYPVGRSDFYDRVEIEQTPPLQSEYVLCEDEYLEKELEELLAEEISISASPTPEPQQAAKSELLDNVSSRSSSYLSSATDDSLYRDPPHLINHLENSIDALLSEILTSAELRLLHKSLEVNDTKQRHSSIDNTLTNYETLICGLHYIITGLQDRNSHLEDTLLPKLSGALEQKSSAINVLTTELQNFHNQIRQLKGTVDFGSKVLEGCWFREYEVWRLLVQIHEKRNSKWNRLVGRITRGFRKRHTETEGHRPLAQGEQTSSSGNGRQQIPSRELDVLLLIAEQNARILREDANDMVEKVEACRFAASASLAIKQAEMQEPCRKC